MDGPYTPAYDDEYAYCKRMLGLCLVHIVAEV